MKPKKANRQNIELSKSDIDAILCALPLVSYYDAGSETQNEINHTFMITASEKLLSHNVGFVPNEYRVIYTAVALAVNFDTYFHSDEIDPEWRNELKSYFFTLNRLYNLTKGQIQIP